MSAKKAPPPEGEGRKVVVTYAGLKRAVFGENVYQRFYTDLGKELLYTGVRRVIVGYRYEAFLHGKKDYRISRRPTVIGPAKVDPEKLQRWRDETIANEEYLKSKREAEKAMKLILEFKPILKPLGERARNLSFQEREAFGRAIVRVIVSGYPER